MISTRLSDSSKKSCRKFLNSIISIKNARNTGKFCRQILCNYAYLCAKTEVNSRQNSSVSAESSKSGLPALRCYSDKYLSDRISIQLAVMYYLITHWWLVFYQGITVNYAEVLLKSYKNTIIFRKILVALTRDIYNSFYNI